jgi:hypothetical protein
MIRRLFGAIVTGVGLRAGEDIYEEGKKRVKEELDRLPKEKTPRQLAKAARAAEKARARADEARATAAKDRERTAEAELAALKKKMGL